MKITVVFDNVAHDKNLQTGWGFAAFIEGLEKKILFDTGGDGPVLLSNMQKLGIDVKGIDIVFLSHGHGDHTGGLNNVLENNKKCKVVSMDDPGVLCKRARSTGQMGAWIKEQSLVIDTKKGLVVIAGCAHPGIVDVVKHVKEYFDKDIYLLMGGFHLEYIIAFKVKTIVSELKELGVRKIAPSHCTGKRAIKLFKQAWGKDFIDLGCGRSISVKHN